MDVRGVAELGNALSTEVSRVILGKPEAVRQVLVGLLGGGHVLIEDIPGVGKTMLARAFAHAIQGQFRRIQFTPDLLPADITGTSIYDQRTGEFQFRPGPVFANVVLADEVNRATPKLQSALLECMEERQVSADGRTHRLPDPFMVIATENPVEFRGTHPLPETQLDRFLLRVEIGYPAHAAEVEMLNSQSRHHPIEDVTPRAAPEEVAEAVRAVREVFVDETVRDYIVRIVEATRQHPEIQLGASPRGSLALLRAAQANAAVAGREFVSPDDVKLHAASCLLHRMVLIGGNREGAKNLIRSILDSVRVPV
jgi:MoxR-like ATPase